MSRDLTRARVPIIIVGGSGSGKTTVANMLRGRGYSMCRIATTRPPRGKEDDDCNFQFATSGEFAAMIENGDLQFWDDLFDQKYGVAKNEIRQSDAFIGPVWRAAELRQAVGESLCIHLLSPESGILRTRLSERPSSGASEIERRVADAYRQNNADIPGFRRVDAVSLIDLMESINVLLNEHGGCGCAR